jgi:hypothetical protein
MNNEHVFAILLSQAVLVQRVRDTEAGISKELLGKISGSPEVELRFCPLAHILQILNWVAFPELFSISL